MPIPGTPSAQGALRDAVEGKEPLPPSSVEKPSAEKVGPKPGTSRPATAEDIWALKLLDANESILGLRQQTLEQARMLADKERIISQLQEVIGKLEAEKFMREQIGLRARFGYVAGQTVLQEDLKTGQFLVAEIEKQEAQKPAQPAKS